MENDFENSQTKEDAFEKTGVQSGNDNRSPTENIKMFQQPRYTSTPNRINTQEKLTYNFKKPRYTDTPGRVNISKLGHMLIEDTDHFMNLWRKRKEDKSFHDVLKSSLSDKTENTPGTSRRTQNSGIPYKIPKKSERLAKIARINYKNM